MVDAVVMSSRVGTDSFSINGHEVYTLSSFLRVEFINDLLGDVFQG